jgi:large subunit ribosomal protein L38e
MPKEIFDIEEFVKISEKAKECRVKKGKNITKLKLRTRRMLYTIKLDPRKAEEVKRRIKCKIVEI